MKSTIFKLFITCMFITGIVMGQNVGINTTGAVADPSAMLDVASTTTGVLVPRVVLTATNVAAPVTAPSNSLLVFNTNTAGVGTATGVIPGYYYWSAAASRWIRVLNDGDAWLTTGNYLGANGVFGTLTNYSIILGTNNVPRGAFMNTGELFLNTGLAYYPGDVFSSYATGGQFAIAGYSNTGASVALYAENNAANVNSVAGWFYTSATGTGWGLLSDITNNANVYPAIAGVTRNLSETGVAGAVNATSTINILVGGSGGAFTSPNTGVYANATNANSNGGLFAANGVAAGSPASGAGVASSGSAIGVYGSATAVASGTGGVFAGNNSGYSTLAGGSGVAGTGVTTGVFGIGNAAANGTGGVFGGNNYLPVTLPGGSGVAALGSTIGVFGMSALTNDAGGGFFQNGNGSSFAYVGYRFAGLDYKIIGAGAVATMVPDLNNQNRTMFCPESPEVLFQDFGSGQLVNGTAVISLDPVFAKNIKVDDAHPLRVIIQLEGDCNGVYVTNKTNNGFEVKELQNGQSDVKFTWFVSANRINSTDANGNVISSYENTRFPVSPVPEGTIQQDVIKGETIIHQTKEIKPEMNNDKRNQQNLNR